MIVNTLARNYHAGVNDLAGYVQKRRAALELTQAELAVRCGLERDYIAQVESGKSKLPEPENRRKLAKGLGVSHLDLLVAAGQITEEERGGQVEVVPDSPVEQLCALIRAIPPDKLEPLRGLAEWTISRGPARTGRAPSAPHRTPSAPR